MKLRNGKALERLSPETADARTLQNQCASPLLRLPGEIRNTIYEYALGGHYIHLRPGKAMVVRTNKGKHVSKSRFLALGRTSRQIHSESAVLLFSLNTFFGVWRSRYQPHSPVGFSTDQYSAITSIGLLACCFGHFSADSFDVVVPLVAVRRVTVVTGSVSTKVQGETVFKVMKEVEKLLGRQVEVVLVNQTTLYQGEKRGGA